MKISIDRERGFHQVRGGHLVSVVADHACTTRGYEPAHYSKDQQRTFAGDWATAKTRDLALEVVAVATGNIVAHTYLTGDAQGLINYGCVMSWFGKPEVLWRATGTFERIRDFNRQPDPEPADRDIHAPTPLGTLADCMAAILRAKYAPPPVRVICAEMRDLAPGELAMALPWIGDALGFEVDDKESKGPPLVRSADVILHAVCRDRRGETGLLHLAAPQSLSMYGASLFQARLLATSPEATDVDLWDAAAYEAVCAAVAPGAAIIGGTHVSEVATS